MGKLQGIVRTTAFSISLAIGLLFFGCVGPSDDPIARWKSRKSGLLNAAKNRSVEYLLEDLESDDAGTRVAAYLTLTKRDPNEVVPVMIQRNDDTTWAFFEYWRPLCSAWGSDALPVLLEYFKPEYLASQDTEEQSDEYWMSWRAVSGFIALGPDASEVGPWIVDILNNPINAPALNGDLCQALASMDYRSDEVTEVLLNILDDEDLIWLRNSACYALGKLASPDDNHVIERLQDYVNDIETNTRVIMWSRVLSARAALYLLGVDQDEHFSVISEKAWPEMVGTVYMAEPEARKALANIGDDRAIAELSDLAKNAEDLSNILIFNYLASIGPEPAVIEGLAECLNPDNLSLEKANRAVYHLGKLGEAARPVLPEMQEYYSFQIENGESGENLVDLEVALIRVHEGIEFPSFLL